mmetsp:Transcript_39863/g.109722  ORF Transcript_39863/g.109722 Transcript_39863/m.109722 type:complete len:299 (+) Transcript_39863:69-965(+)
MSKRLFSATLRAGPSASTANGCMCRCCCRLQKTRPNLIDLPFFSRGAASPITQRFFNFNFLLAFRHRSGSSVKNSTRTPGPALEARTSASRKRFAATPTSSTGTGTPSTFSTRQPICTPASKTASAPLSAMSTTSEPSSSTPKGLAESLKTSPPTLRTTSFGGGCLSFLFFFAFFASVTGAAASPSLLATLPKSAAFLCSPEPFRSSGLTAFSSRLVFPSLCLPSDLSFFSLLPFSLPSFSFFSFLSCLSLSTFESFLSLFLLLLFFFMGSSSLLVAEVARLSSSSELGKRCRFPMAQ